MDNHAVVELLAERAPHIINWTAEVSLCAGGQPA
jgi:hypothetical protein